LDYCNILFSGLRSTALKKLQLVQNTVARILTRTCEFEHIIPVLRNLITSYVPPCPLRSQEVDLLIISRINTKSLRNRAFSYCASLLLNKLPAALKEADSIEMFKSRLKTHLFSSYFE
ncbi:hypothetical protein LDENG_00292780, partial [Lucifuga dentata]